jgi:hypothetical protein
MRGYANGPKKAAAWRWEKAIWMPKSEKRSTEYISWKEVPSRNNARQ